MYDAKIIQDLKPEWYRKLSSKEKINIQSDIKSEQNKLWAEKPKDLSGVVLISKKQSKYISKDKKYIVRNYFATLVSTVYGANWREFVTIKNDYGYTIKVSVDNFYTEKELHELSISKSLATLGYIISKY